MVETKSFLRWAGSKQQLLPYLSQYWKHSFSRYLEPFMGSAKLFFTVSPQTALISDLNSDLIEVYNQIKTNPRQIIDTLSEFEIGSDHYYRIRSIDPTTLDPVQRSARFLYLNRLCFNGLYRTNKKNQFNVPYSGEIPKEICDAGNLLRVSEKLQNCEILQGDFEEVVKKNITENDFVYLDPPYAIRNVRIFNQYGPETFGLNDLERLKRLLKLIEEKSSYFLLSYAYSEEALDLFSEYNIQKVSTNRNIAGYAKFRRPADEVLISNFKVTFRNGR